MSIEQLEDIGMKLRENITKRFNNEFINHQLLKMFVHEKYTDS